MKKMKNTASVMIAGLLIACTAIVSCGKKSNTPSGPAAPTISSFSPTTAREGATITINGANLTGATVVSFGGVAATSFTIIDGTRITAVVGNGASGAVSVTTSGGTGTLAGFTFDSSLPPVNGYNSSNEVEASALIAYWPFDGNTTEATHSAAPVLQSAAATRTFVPGVIGQAISFNKGWLTYGPGATGVGADNTTWGSNDTLQYGFTLSLWAQVPDTSTLTQLFGLSFAPFPNWSILGISYRKGGGVFDFNGMLGNVDGAGPHLSYASAFSPGLFNDSLPWLFLAMTYSPADVGKPAELRYYANGSLRATVDLSTIANKPFPDPAAALLILAPNYVNIGASGGAGNVPGATLAVEPYMNADITGKIDDIRLFKRQLTDTQIESLFLLGTQGR
ncbi:MAG TPA: IPT/TIG domain-containing protein [Ferruginibacter sp.]|nr:IPT/TIG domain-containing protein [Ferruginibacter sp.]HMP22385.1 IPT/TIG domain-containing protein [Ferruginibacter sp.]